MDHSSLTVLERLQTESWPRDNPAAEASPLASGFADLLDVLNPLQHLPLVSGQYRKLSGDEVGEGARTVGDILYGALGGGVIGVVGGLVNAVFRAESGKDLSEQALSWLGSEEKPPAAVSDNQLAAGGELDQQSRISTRDAQAASVAEVADASTPSPKPEEAGLMQVQKVSRWRMAYTDDSLADLLRIRAQV